MIQRTRIVQHRHIGKNMVEILAHRGLWRDPAEHNAPDALLGALRAGNGIETDLRDRDGRVVVSHDMPISSSPDFAGLLGDLCAAGPGTLALNVKADGLAGILAPMVRDIRDRCFFFDMSVPDMRGYFEHGLPVYTRHSDAETAPSFYEQSAGVWLDELAAEWISAEVISAHLSAGKKVAVVSGELHGRDHARSWEIVRRFADDNNVMICTDLPAEFREAMA